MIIRPTIRQLEYFVAVAETLNFRRAAEACFVTQPGLSAQIQQLEETLGVRLFERDRRKVLLTHAGERALVTARRVLTATDELVSGAESQKNPLASTLQLGVIPTIAPYLLPRLTPAVHRAYPELRLLLREAQTAELVELTEDGELDLILVATEADLGGLAARKLFTDRFLVALPPGHSLTKRKRLKPSDLHGEQVLLLEDGHCLREQTTPICDAAGACELADFRATSLGTLIQMVAAGIGLTLVPEMASASTGAVETRPFSTNAPSRTIGLAWRPASPHEEEFELLADLMATAVNRP